jgi:hypothetical protein
MRRLLKFENQLLLRSRRELGELSPHIQFERDAELILYSHQTAGELNGMDPEVRLLNSSDTGVSTIFPFHYHGDWLGHTMQGQLSIHSPSAA